MSVEKTRLEQLRRAVALQRLQQREDVRLEKALPPAIAKADRNRPLPLSWAQQRLWFLDQLDHAAGAAYHMPAALRLRGTLDRDALKATLDRIVARHENLRATFVNVEGQPTQVIAPVDSGFTLIEHDLGDLDSVAQEAAIATLGIEEASTLFDLTRDPLIRGRLLRLSQQEHVLLLTQHHIISDGWSIGVLVREVTALYAAFIEGRADPLPPLAIQYADYALWQREWLQGETLQRQLDYWRNRLVGAPALLELPADRARPPVQSYQGGRVTVTFPPKLASAVRALSERHGTTLFMTLLAGWSAFLSRMSRQEEVVIGTSVANRRRIELEPLIGLFLNALALRVDLGADPTVAELLAQIKATTLDAYEHQDLPFEQVVEALQPTRSMSYSPIFQTMLTFNNTPSGGELRLPRLALEVIDTPRHTAHFDLELALRDHGDVIDGTFAYATDLFDRETMERYVEYFLSLFQAMASDDGTRISRLPLLSATQREQVLARSTRPPVPYQFGSTVHALFEDQARGQPDAPALSFDGKTLSYAELNRRANRVAHRLIALGVQPDDRVAICIERSLEMVVGLLGVLKAGGGYVPLDPSYPSERLAYMLEDSAPVAVLATTAVRAAVPALATCAQPILMLDAWDDAALEAQPTHDPIVADLGPRQLAYVIYTSGSTGQPKGVMIEHRAAVNYLEYAHAQYLQPTVRGSVVTTPFGFDATVTSLMTPWLSGKPVVLLAEESHETLTQLLARFGEPEPWLFKLTPAHLDALSHLAPAPVSGTAHVLVVGGEQLTTRTVERFRTRVLPSAELINEYGPTETVVGCATHHCRVDTSPHTGHAVPIGSPTANMRIYLLDAHGEPVPPGVSGEVYIGGMQMARGYLGRPDLTAERFVRDPFVLDADARMYRTGDIARWLPTGELEYLGRNDFQVKIRGFRIELGEIEAKLAACAGVHEAVVLAREDTPGDKRLIAYVVAAATVEAPGAESLREALARDLAEYMIPSAFVMLPSMPLTANGKVDRKALPVPGETTSVRVYEAPIGENEQILAEVWQGLLNVERVSRHDHFFELGGHSLLAISLIERLRQRGLGADPGIIFTTPTLSVLAERLTSISDAAPTPATPANLIPDAFAASLEDADIEEFKV